MHTLRTPDDRFDGLPDFPSPPTTSRSTTATAAGCASTTSTRDRPTARSVLLMHGEPSWCFLYRHMVPVLVDAGLRCIAPDLVGFGRSDKPAAQSDYTYARHVEWMRAAAARRARPAATSRWSARTGAASSACGCVAEHPDRFARIVVANTGLPTGDRTPDRRVPGLAAVLAGGRRLPRRRHRQRRLHHRARARGDRRLRRAVPRRLVQGRRPHLPDARAHQPRRPGRRAPTGRRGTSSGAGTSRCSPRSPTRTRSPAAASARSRRWCRAPRAAPTPRSRAAATSCRRTAAPSWRAVVDLVAATPRG